MIWSQRTLEMVDKSLQMVCVTKKGRQKISDDNIMVMIAKKALRIFLWGKH